MTIPETNCHFDADTTPNDGTHFFVEDQEEMRAIKRARQAENELQTLLRIIPGGVAKILCGEGFTLLRGSAGYYRMTGYTKEELCLPPICNRVDRLVIEADRAEVALQSRLLTPEHPSMYLDYRIRQKDGTTVWNTAYVLLLEEDESGKTVEALFLDTTNAKVVSQQLAHLVDYVDAGLAHIEFDAQNKTAKLHYASYGFYRLIGRSQEEFAENGDLFQDLNVVHPEDSPRLLEEITAFCGDTQRQVLHFEFRSPRKEGCRHLRMAMTRSESGFLEFDCVLFDITEEQAAEKALELAEERYRVICEQTQDIVFDWDMKTDQWYYSPVFQKKFGYAIPKEDTLSFFLQTDILHSGDRVVFANLIRGFRSGMPYDECEYRVKTASGDYIWCRVRAVSLQDEQKKPYRVLGIMTDIHAEKLRTESLLQQAQYDLLTGIYNRDATRHKVEEVLQKSTTMHCHVLLLVDVDHFSQINKDYGYLAGDSVMTLAAGQLQKNFRENDILGRVGSNCFVLLLKNIQSKSLALQKAAIAKNIFKKLDSGFGAVTASVGVALYPQDGMTYPHLYERAEAALGEAKQQGDSAVLYSEYMRLRELPVRTSESFSTLAYDHKLFITTILDILYRGEDREQAIGLVLNWVGQQVRIQHMYIYGFNEYSSLVKYFEYCSGTALPFDQTADQFYMKAFNEKLLRTTGQCALSVSTLGTLPDEIQQELRTVGIQAILQIPILEQGKCRGIFGFCDTNPDRSWNSEQIETCTFIAKIMNAYLFAFLSDQHDTAEDSARER